VDGSLRGWKKRSDFSKVFFGNKKHRRRPLMKNVSAFHGNGNSGAVDFLEEIIRNRAREVIESLYDDEVQKFLDDTAHLVDETGHRKAVRNGSHKERTVLTTSGYVTVRLPRVDDRELEENERFASSILPPFARKTATVEAVLSALYLAGVSSNKFPEALRAVLGDKAKGISTAVICRLTLKWQTEYDEWRKRDLSGKEYIYVWADGVYVKSRLDDAKTCLLVIIGVTDDGRKELVALQDGVRESTQSWREVLLDLKSRGLEKSPKLAVCDGALGFQNAVDEIWGQLKIQRCWFHKTANILDKLPDCVQTKATQMIRNMWMAPKKAEALKSFDLFIETFGAKYPRAVECLEKDKDDLFRFYDFPAEHWAHIRTSNPIESTFATVRLRHRSTKGNGSAKATIAMAFKLCLQAEKGWRRLRGFKMLELVARDILFVDGVLKEVA
jgi:transposase-like protein